MPPVANTRDGSDSLALVSREFLEPVLSASRIVVWSWDFATDAVTWLGNAEDVLGYNFKDREQFVMSVHPEDRQRVADALLRAKAGEKAYAEEFRVQLAAGAVLWVAERATIRRDLHGGPVAMSGVLMDISERKHSEQALHYQHQLTRSITDNAAEAIFLLDREGRVTFMNPEAEKMFGYRAEELLGQILHDKVHYQRPDGRYYPMAECPLVNVFSRGMTLRSHEDVFIAKDGRRLDVVCSNSPIRDDAKVTGAVLVVHDTTAQKDALRTLQASEERYRSLTRILTSVVWTSDANGAFVAPQTEWETFTGQPWEEHRGMGWIKMLHPEDRIAFEESWKSAVEQRSCYLISGRVWHAASAAYRYFALRAVPLMNENGAVREWIGTLTDIHDQRNAEEESRKSHERFTAIFEQAFVGICQVDLSGKFVLANQRFCEMVGRPLDDLLNLRMQEITHPDDLARNLTLFDAAAAGGSGYEIEKRYLRPDGSAVWTRLQVAVIRNSAGEPEFVTAVCEDVTARKHAEEQLAQLIQRERAAREEAERANRAKDDFLAALSHELRTPLTPVLMSAAVRAEDPTLDPGLRKEFALICRNVELEARLIDDLLDLTRITRGKLPLLTANVDLHALLAHTAEIVRADAENKGVWITFDLEAAECWVQGDLARLQQVVWNLLKNAIKFTPTDGQITLQTSNPTPDHIEITVSDSGIGIASEHLARIFEAFEQADVAGQHRFGGLGLGLAISKAIVELHRGTISVRSDGKGKGATFSVRLTTIPPPEDAGSEVIAVSTGTVMSLRLLVVEDHAPTLGVLTRLLERRGHRVEPASTVHGALALAGAHAFDAVISDIGLPDGSGMELMQELSKKYGLRGIALSGYGMEEDLVRSREVGFLAHLVKPVTFDRLDEALVAFMRPTNN